MKAMIHVDNQKKKIHYVQCDRYFLLITFHHATLLNKWYPRLHLKKRKIVTFRLIEFFLNSVFKN